MPTAARAAKWCLTAALGAAAACTHALEPATPVAAPLAPKDSLELAIFLIGDAGSKAYDGEPVLKELALQSDSLRPVHQFVVFLGDNVYPRGVPPLGNPNRDDAERKIAAQVLAIRKGSAQGLLIPGNHDWDRQGLDGWSSILRQDTLVRKFGGQDVRLAPAGGCPGPVVVDLGAHVRLIAMDTQWWLHNDVKPYGDTSPCPTRTYDEVRDSLEGALRDKGERQAIVLTHNAYFSPPSSQPLPFDMGLAWEVRNRRPDSPTILTKNGATSRAGHTCAIALMPDRQMGIALLTNIFGQGSDPTGLGIDILRTLAT